MREDGAHPGVLERLDRGIGVRRGREVVRPVDERRDAAVERLESAEVVAGVGVLGAEVLAESGVQAREVLGERPVRRDLADHRLPGVAMGVDEAGENDASGDVDDLGISGIEIRADRGDHAVRDEDVGADKALAVGGRGDDVAVAEQGVVLPSSSSTPCSVHQQS